MRFPLRRPQEPTSWARLWIALGAAATALGIFLAGATPIGRSSASERSAPQRGAGGVLVLVGWGLLAWGIHRFGRAADGDDGPDRAARGE
jgi:hypothetical protein